MLALELSGPERFTVFIDHPQRVDHALCARVTEVLGPYLREYTIDVSSPGVERPLRTPAHFERVVGKRVALRTLNASVRAATSSARAPTSRAASAFAARSSVRRPRRFACPPTATSSTFLMTQSSVET